MEYDGSNMYFGNVNPKNMSTVKKTAIASKKFDHFKGLSMALLGAVLLGESGTVAQVLFQRYGFNPGWLVTVRMIVAGLLLLIGISIKTGPMQTILVWKNKRDALQLILL